MKNIDRPFMFWTLLVISIITLVGCRPTIKEEYYSDGTLKSSVEYRGKKMHGVAREYYENGQLRSVRHYVNGLEDGLSQYYGSDGKIMSDVEMKNGKREGRMRTYYFNADREMECFYKDDKLNGKQTNFDRLGNRVAEMYYVDDKADGPYKAWYSKSETVNNMNALRETGAYKQGTCVGHWEYYDENEHITAEADFKDGEGVMTTYSLRREVAKITHFIDNNVKDGDEQIFDDNGNLVRTITYQRDKIVAIDGQPVERE